MRTHDEYNGWDFRRLSSSRLQQAARTQHQEGAVKDMEALAMKAMQSWHIAHTSKSAAHHCRAHLWFPRTS